MSLLLFFAPAAGQAAASIKSSVTATVTQPSVALLTTALIGQAALVTAQRGNAAPAATLVAASTSADSASAVAMLTDTD